MHVIEAGTDVATLVLFDPAALPRDFDQHARTSFPQSAKALDQEGRLKLIGLDGDGAYLLHAYVGEAVPDYLTPYLRDPTTAEKFLAPSGRIYFAGAEYSFANDDLPLRKHPHMGGSFSVPPGPWHLTLYRTEYPVDFHDDLFRSRLGDGPYRLIRAMGSLIALAFVAALGAVISFLRIKTWGAIFLPIALGFVALPILLGRSRTYRHTEQKKLEIEREYPSVVAVLNPVSS